MSDPLDELEKADDAQVPEETGRDWRTLQTSESPEELEKAKDAQALEEARDDWKTLQMSESLEELEIDDSSPVAPVNALERVTHHQASHDILTFACCRSLHTGTLDVCLLRQTIQSNNYQHDNTDGSGAGANIYRYIEHSNTNHYYCNFSKMVFN